jgi:formamidopyrimidine-DNA glycosylase
VPELPEVETVRRGLNQVTLNQKILGGEVLLNSTIAHPLSSMEFLAGLKDTAITGWHRRGKYLLAELAPAGWLGVHLRMTGQLLWVDLQEPLQKHTRVRLRFASQELRFVDQRTFGQMWWVPPTVELESVITGLQKLGPDPFSKEFTLEYLTGKLRNRRRPIKTALLDQAIIAGLGNIYADEALFLTGIRSATLCSSLTLEQVDQLRTAIIQVLKTSIEAGGTTFSNFLNVQGINGNYGGVAWVYNREGEPCRVCRTLIQRVKLAGRSAHFCPQCQH